ncbi:hypothetical protein FEM48_ZijujUnG0055300 [Ziziphus jujuba var. spinosa]|uniref:Xyloglucan endotransglucosylase/hydrolase n=1 Tax=Ziziphus jujuba var. spinosa TaxID=714518 RepID=A0A978U991_ZIZJJ|nr:hypothetical protein FEM48_ZijujUnG0055300 [Ziziphus jujuba var. spinosa]
MAFSQVKPLFLALLILCMSILVSCHSRHFTPPIVTRLTDLFPHVSINNSFYKGFGVSNIQLTGNGFMATLSLDKASGSGLVSKNKYQYGFFSASIKLPSGLSPGVVVAFYLSNADVYPHNHDEIDIELLGHDKRNDWAFQTNIYANGSVSTGREEKFYLWFDPTEQHHQYSILWNSHHIVFLVDNIPVREFPRNNMEMSGCISSNPTGSVCSKSNPSSLDPVDGQEFAKLSNQQVVAMDWARRKLMFYSYCKDLPRFKVLPPECK